MWNNFLHSLNTLWLNCERLTQALILKHFTHLVEVSNLDIAGDIDLVYAACNGFFDFIIRIGRTTVEYQRGIRKFCFDLFEDINTKMRIYALRINSVAGADCDSKAVNSGFLDESDSIIRIGVFDFCRTFLAEVISSSDGAKFAFYGYIYSMCSLNNLFADGNILFEGFGRGVDHNRSKTTLNGSENLLISGTVIQVNSNRNRRLVSTVDDSF